MRWVLISVGLLVVIVIFSLAALDQRDVIWNGDVPQCPHCRSEVHLYSKVCAVCRRDFDWQTRETECRTCLSELDRDYLADLAEEHAEELEKKIESLGLEENDRENLEEYIDGLRPGACGFCGGTGNWVEIGLDKKEATNGGSNPLLIELKRLCRGDCPVCLGSGRCICCGGDRRVVHGRESSARASEDLSWKLGAIDPGRDRKSAEAAWEAISDFVRRHEGTAEAEHIPCFDVPADLHDTRAVHRQKAVVDLIESLAK